jgi:16S rRNA processing protein RimM
MQGDRRVLLGRVVGVFGVAGWVKVESFTEPRDNILRYRPWTVVHGGNETQVEKPQGRTQGKGLVAKLPQADDRDQAAALLGAELFVDRAQLPEPSEGEIYWADLEGLEVVLEDGTLLGTVSHLFPTGANDVIVVRGAKERLIPYVEGVVKSVDLEARRVTVDWDPDF